VEGSNENQDAFDVVMSKTSLLIELMVGKDDGRVNDWGEGRKARCDEATDSNRSPFSALELGVEHDECRQQRQGCNLEVVWVSGWSGITLRGDLPIELTIDQ
jgi:hypothetical protein